MISHGRSNNSPLLIVFSANYQDQSINRYFHVAESRLDDFHPLKKCCTVFKIPYLIGRIQDAICKYKVHTKFT